ncbi:hypothetical protein [Nocardia wallacei]|nr:hypothetical protein [Nocardia wallacei]
MADGERLVVLLTAAGMIAGLLISLALRAGITATPDTAVPDEEPEAVGTQNS